MREAARELGILFVVDEVITGFGRTGPMFACEAEGVEPDLMTLAKGLTSGYVPMGATMMSEAVYAGIADGAGRRRADRPRRHLFGASGRAPPSRSRCSGSTRRAACSPMGSASRRTSRRARWRCASTRWSAMRAIAACSARWNWSATRPIEAQLRSGAGPVRPHLRRRLSQRPRVPLLRRRHPRLRAGADLRRGRVRAVVRAPAKDAGRGAGRAATCARRWSS